MNYNHKTDWYYEGNISRILVNHFAKKRYDILKDNSDNIRAKGEDIIIKNEKHFIVIEVKGYPTRFHTKGPKKGERKTTKPELQAKHWFKECISTSILNYRNHSKTPNLILAIGLPKFNLYEDLLKNIKPYFSDNKLMFIVYFVDENEKVEEINLYKKV